MGADMEAEAKGLGGQIDVVEQQGTHKIACETNALDWG